MKRMLASNNESFFSCVFLGKSCFLKMLSTVFTVSTDLLTTEWVMSQLVCILARLKSAHYSASSVLIFVLCSYMNEICNNLLSSYEICSVYSPFLDTNNILLKGGFIFYFNSQKIGGNLISVSEWLLRWIQLDYN